MKARKKPIVVDVVQWLPERKPTDFPDWFWAEFGPHPERFNSDLSTLTIPTLEGRMICRHGDWIIRGVQGELYPCKPDIFAATYDLIKDKP